MAIRTGGDNRKGARAGGPAGGRQDASVRVDGNSVAQFAPNFSVYVLPPDAVCLYSEDRKFFLHGELYVALAAAIGKGGKSFAQLVRALARRRPDGAGRARGEARARPHGHAGGRLSRRTARPNQQAASGGPHALAAGA